MKVEKVNYFCDICKKEASVMGKEMQCIFTTEQTEGRSIKPHFTIQEIDLCQDCLNKALGGNYIWGHGAQGHNEYYFENLCKER